MAFPEAMSAIQKHIRAADTLAAIGAGFGAAAGRIEPGETLNAKLETVINQFEPGLLEGLKQEEIEALYGFVRAAMRQMLHLLELPDDGSAGWSYDDPGILETQGRSSRLVTRLLTDYASRDSEFGARLSGGARFLDVGSGVGWISLSMAQEWPNVTAVGIDILDAALKLAEQNLEQTGLADRVSFRKQNVVDLKDVDAFDFIFVPAIFIPEVIIEDTFRNLYRALKPGGWLFAAAYRVPDDSKLAALNDLRTTLSGGRAWSAQELGTLARTAGLQSIGDIAAESPLHLWASRREA
jgi:SAM-dependent methyltransferase